ncbi:hypothetical protein [Halocola ammonii]
MKRYFTFLSVLLLSAVLFTSCSKEEEEALPPAGYTCGCGNVNWTGSGSALLDANYIVPIDTLDYSRKYYLTADIRGENPSMDITHNLNVEIEIMDVTPLPLEQVGFFIPKPDTVEVRVEDVRISEAGTEIKRYRTMPYDSSSVITVQPSFFGSTESVNFNVNVRRILDNGQPAGFPVNISGDFTVTPQN